MAATWVKGFNPKDIAYRLNESKLAKDDGKVSFDGLSFSEYIAVLDSMISLHCQVPKLEKSRIVSKAAFNAASKGVITDELLLAEISKLEQDYLSQIPNKYVLLASLSINPYCKLKKVIIDDCIITFCSFPPLKFDREIRDKILPHATYSIFSDLPKNYICVKITVTAKSHIEAAERALEAIDFLRGIWNLFYNRGQTFRWSSGERHPVNNIVIGPLHTLHCPNGKLATESWWYETSYLGASKVFNIDDIESLYKYQTFVRRHLQRSNYGNFFKKILVRYARALDLRDWENAFLRLWGLLESLTHTRENESHKVTVRRASFLFKDPEYVKQVLTHLKNYRNMAVHAGEDHHNIETMMYQLKRFVEVLLQFQIANSHKFKHQDEVVQFLDMPYDMKVLARKMKLIEYAVKFRGK